MSLQGRHSFPQRRTYGPGFVTEAWGFHPGLKGEVMSGHGDGTERLMENGRIKEADIVFSRGFALDCWITLEFDGSGQGFGGYVLGGNPFDTSTLCAKHHEQKNLAADFIGGVMAVADVQKFSSLVGKVIRVKRGSPFGLIEAIGHPFKDIWYEPKKRFALLAGEAA